MYLYGKYKLENNEYIVVMKQNKSGYLVYIMNGMHVDDISARILGNPIQHPVYINAVDFMYKLVRRGYIVSAYKKLKVSGKVSYYGRRDLFDKFATTLMNANNYTFAEKNVVERKVTYDDGVKIEEFRALDDNLAVYYEKIDNELKELEYKSSDTSLNLSYRESYTRFEVKEDEFTEVNDDIQKKVAIASLPDIRLEDIASKSDLSWVKGKDYNAVQTKEKLDDLLEDMVQEYFKQVEECGYFLISVDTETTGLNIYELSKDNPDRDHIVATPISWKDDQARVIFNDMEHFSNIDAQYMVSKIKPFLVKGEEFTLAVKGKTYTLDRRKIILVGHNCMFDARVFLQEGIHTYWNDDTMSMSFNLDPKSAKGKFNNKLKGITRRLFGHETPELEDVTGKGNADKYRYIKDLRVAVLYGCADADYTRKCWKELRELMPNYLYKVYRKQDMPMLNILYPSEFIGLTVDEPKVKLLADKTEKDLEEIHKFLEYFIGKSIAKKNVYTKYKLQLQNNMITEEEFTKNVYEYKPPEDAKYEFKMNATSYREILFNQLGYPVISRTDTGQIQTNKNVLKKLSSVKLDKPSNKMKEDLMSSDGERVLIEAKEFNKLKYPVAYVLQQYSTLRKEFDGDLKPIRDRNLEGHKFASYSLTRIETFRIQNPSQTLKGSLKELVLPYDGGKDWYLVDFDMAQVEYRIMVSLASCLAKHSLAEEDYKHTKAYGLVQKLRDPERDYHVESASNFFNVPVYEVTKKLRKTSKKYNFGVPYGLSDYSLCADTHDVVNETTLYQTRELLETFNRQNAEIIAMLNHNREEALIPRDFREEFQKKDKDYNEKFKKFCGYYEETDSGEIKYKDVGWVKNDLGRYRLFDLSDMNRAKQGTIERAAGNFPIQSFAAELFRKILINFYNRCEKEGILDKTKWHMLIHDELLLSVHKSINPFYIYKIILEECMVTLEGHTDYFVGINLGDTWADCKNDANEAPVYFVRDMVRRWDEGEFLADTWVDNPKEYVQKHMDKYFTQRIHEELKRLQPNIDEEPIDYRLISKELINYTVRGYLTDKYIPSSLYGKWKSLNDGTKLCICLCQWAKEYYGLNKMVKCKGVLINIENYTKEHNQKVKIDSNLVENDEFLDMFDDYGDYIDAYDVNLYNNTDVYDEESKKFIKEGQTEKKYIPKYVKNMNSRILITVDRSFQKPKIHQLLKSLAEPKGKKTFIKTKTSNFEKSYPVPLDIDIVELDRKIKEVLCNANGV